VNGAPILVVGRSGQLATDLVAAARREGVPLVALGRPELDLTEADGAARALAAIRPRAVVNAAAYTAVDRAESEPDRAFAVNRDGPARLARAAVAAGVPLIHVSTDQVFDGRRPGGYRESDAPNPLCSYGRSKLAGEEAVAAAGGTTLIVRVSWVFGPSGDNFVTKVIAWARQREVLAIVSDQRGRPTHSPALAAALLTLAARMADPTGAERPAGLLHLAGATVMTREAQARAIIAASSARGGPFARIAPVTTADFPTPATRPLNAELDCSLAAERYGIGLGSFAADLAATLDALIGRPRGAARPGPGETS
jgi:dTDP-4-dehydrorhamnose reductase